MKINVWEEHAVLERDEYTGRLFWRIVSDANKDSTRLDDGESIQLNPNTFKVGTIVTIKELFYE